MRLAGMVLAMAGLAAAQDGTRSGTMSGHSGFSFADTLQTATEVVVADIISGEGVDDGSQVTVRARVRVVRTLKGRFAPGAELGLAWQYRPLLTQGPAVTSKVPLERGVWFLHERQDGGVAPMQASAMDIGPGGYYLPAGDAPRYYGPSATLDEKIAAEIAPVIEAIATQHGSDLRPRPYPQQPPLAIPDWAKTRARFGALVGAMQNLNTKAKCPVYADFSARPDPNLKALGIAGRLDCGDASALLDLEANLAAVAPVYEQGVAFLSAGPTDLRGNTAAAKALARLAIGETAVPSIEGMAAMALAGTRDPQFLPYFVVMLESPAPWVRDGVLMQFCVLLRGGPLWKEEMAAHCPNHAPLNDAAAERTEIAYWKSWWEANRVEVAKLAPLADVRPPARYRVAAAPVVAAPPMPPEFRLMSLVGMRAQADHYHLGDGTIATGAPPGPVDPVFHQLGEEDRKIYREILDGLQAKLDANDKRTEQMMNAARVAGRFPDLAQMKPLNDERNAALKTAYDGLRNRLTPAGWQAVEKFLSSGGFIMAAPLPAGK